MSNLTASTNGHDEDVWAPDGRRYIEGKYPPPRPSPIELEGGVQLAAFGLSILGALLGLLGAGISFAKVADAVEPYFGVLAPTVPLGIDIGIAVFTGIDLLMAHMGMRTRWLRFVPWTLVGATVFLNVADETMWVGRVAHAVLPLLWVIIVEVGAHIVRHRAGLSGRGKVKRDKIPFSRWVLAPRSTVRLWRWMVLWGERSYDAGLAKWQDMEIAKVRLSSLADPDPEQVVLFRQGRLTPTDVVTELGRPTGRPLPTAPDVPALPSGRPSARKTGRSARQWSDDQWVSFAREVADGLGDGQKLSGYQLRKAARAEGRTLSNGRAERFAAMVGDGR
jgi:hypothetical protein